MELDADWLQRLHARAKVPPAQPRWPLWVGAEPAGAPVGSLDGDVLKQIDQERASDLRRLLSMREQSTPDAAPRLTLIGAPQTALAALAGLLRDLGLTGRWRNEQLAVCRPGGARVATVERAATRVLGIATRAVHLIGTTPDGHVWVQQRAHDKATDAGLWDTLMGGMVAASDNLSQALERETWEEAGLDLRRLQHLRAGGWVRQQRPAPAETGASGWIDEIADWFVATVPAGLAPVNQDGEVAAFECLSRSALRDRLQADAFTIEASMILVDYLRACP